MLPGVAAPIVGAPGRLGVMTTVCVTSAATLKFALPDWLAAITQLPALTIVTVVSLTPQTAGDLGEYVTANNDDAFAGGEIVNVFDGLGLNATVPAVCGGKVIV